MRGFWSYGRCGLALVLALAIPVAARPAPLPPTLAGWRVVDAAGAVDAVSAEAVGRLARPVAQRGGLDLAFLVVPALGDEPLDVLAARTYRGWRLGGFERDLGVLVVVALRERTYGVRVGVALEATPFAAGLPQILDRTLLPALREGGRLGPALVAATQGLLTHGGVPAREVAKPQEPRSDWTGLLAFMAILVPLAAKLFGNHLGFRLSERIPPMKLTRLIERGTRVEVRTHPHAARLLAWALVGGSVLVASIALHNASVARSAVVCQPEANLCTVASSRRPTEFLWLGKIRAFEVRLEPPRKHRSWALVAVTRLGNVPLAFGEYEELTGAAAELTRVFKEPGDRRFSREGDPAAGLAFAAALLALALWLGWLSRSWRVVFDRELGLVRSGRWPNPSHFTPDEISGLQLRTELDDLGERVRRERRTMPWSAPSPGDTYLVLLAHGGERIIASARVPLGFGEELKEAASVLAAAIGVPVVAPPEPPARGTVPV